MNGKERNELRRRFKPEKGAIRRIYGCYVNTKKEIISYIDAPLVLLPPEEAEKYLGLLKKTLSGTLGRNLMEIVFSTRQVVDSDAYRLLSALRDSELKDGDVRQTFYETVIDRLNMGEHNYLILLAHDAYEVPHRGRKTEEQETVFSYIVGCVCPVKTGKPELGFFPGENEFHNLTAEEVVSAPELGFLFPAFDDRAANIYNALYYVRKPADLHQEFIDAVFHVEPPMSATEQREYFESILVETLEEACRLEVVQSVHERLREKLEEQKSGPSDEPLAVTVEEVGDILRDCGVEETRLAAFQAGCAERFGTDAALTPANLIDRSRFEVRTEEASISINPAYSFLVEARAIEGRNYILIPAGNGVEVNGIPVHLGAATEDGGTPPPTKKWTPPPQGEQNRRMAVTDGFARDGTAAPDDSGGDGDADALETPVEAEPWRT